MTTLLIIGGYLLVALPLWRRFAGYLAAPDDNPKFEWGFGIVFGGLGALIWPAVLAIMLGSLIGGAIVGIVSREAPGLLMSGTERAWRSELRKREIKQAEEEVGL